MQISARPRMRARYFAAGEAMDISRQYRGGQVGRGDRALAPAAASAAASFLLAAALCTVRADAVRSVLRRSLPSGLGALVCPAPAVPVRWAVDGEAMCGGGARRPRTALPRMCRRPRVSLGRGTRSPVGVDDLACPKARGLGGVSGQRRVGCRGSWSRGGPGAGTIAGAAAGGDWPLAAAAATVTAAATVGMTATATAATAAIVSTVQPVHALCPLTVTVRDPSSLYAAMSCDETGVFEHCVSGAGGEGGMLAPELEQGGAGAGAGAGT